MQYYWLLILAFLNINHFVLYRHVQNVEKYSCDLVYWIIISVKNIPKSAFPGKSKKLNLFVLWLTLLWSNIRYCKFIFLNFQICNACQSGFTHRKTLIRHIQDKHPEEMCGDISSQAYVSNFDILLTPFQWLVSSNFSKHLISISNWLHLQNCFVCSAKFEYFVNMKQHMKHFHPDDSQCLLEKKSKHFVSLLFEWNSLHCNFSFASVAQVGEFLLLLIMIVFRHVIFVKWIFNIVSI